MCISVQCTHSACQKQCGPQGQTEMWTATENWINKQKDNRIILQGDLNSAHPGARWDYAQPLNKDIGTADKKLEHFIKTTNGNFYAQQEHTWKGKECRAALDQFLPGTITSHPRSPEHFLNLSKNLTTAKYGPNFLTLIFPNKPAQPGLPNPIFPSVLTLSSSNDT